MEFQALLKLFSLPFGLLLLFLCSPQFCSSQELSMLTEPFIVCIEQLLLIVIIIMVLGM